MSRVAWRLAGGRRLLASVAMLAVAGFATLATSASQTEIPSNTISGSLHVDEDHPLAVQDFTVALSDVALIGDSGSSVTVSRSDTDTSVRLTVVQAEPAAALASPTQAYAQSALVPRGVEITPGGRQTVTLDCRTGPCQRRFQVIAERVPGRETSPGSGVSPDPHAGIATWQATAGIVYGGNWPSGASVTLALGDQVSISGKDRSLSAAIPTQHVVLDETHPATATVIEVRFAPSALPANPGDAITTAVVDGLDNSYWAGGIGIEQIEASPAGGALDLPGQFDPTSGCTAGVECVRKYMLYSARGFEYPSTSGFGSYDLGFHVSQLWLRGTVPPADALQVRVVARLTVDPAKKQTLHFEGDLTLQPTDQGRYQFTTVAVDIAPPEAAPSTPGAFVRYAPVPAIGEANAVPDPGSSILPNALDVNVGGSGIGSPFRNVRFQAGETSETQTLQIAVSVDRDTKFTGPLVVHWSIDLTLYAYKDLPPFVMTKG